MNIKLLAIDIAKNVFQLHGVDPSGKAILKRSLKRVDLMKFISQLSICTIAMEACGGANYWGRRFKSLGHEVKLISPQFVKPYVKSNKNDRNDAEAIAKAAQDPDMRFVAIKNVELQDIQSVHRIRQRLIEQRTALSNQTRGLLAEYGVSLKPGIAKLRCQIPQILEQTNHDLTAYTQKLVCDLYEQLLELDKKITYYDGEIKQICAQNEACQRLMKVEGVGPLIATAMLATMGDPGQFKNGRHFAAFLGLVPRQNSSGGKDRLLGISKRGDTYMRTLLIHGCRSVVYRVDKKQDKRSQWLKELKARRGTNRTCVALANKNARILWALLANQDIYRQAL